MAESKIQFNVTFDIQECMLLSTAIQTVAEILSRQTEPCCELDKNMHKLFNGVSERLTKKLCREFQKFFADMTEEQLQVLRLGCALGPLIPKAGGYPEELLPSEANPLIDMLKGAAEAVMKKPKPKKPDSDPSQN